MPQIIGLNGFKKSGKDTTYSILTNLYGDGDAVVQRAAFADKLKIAAGLALGFDRSPLELIELMDTAKDYWDISILDMGREYHTLSGREYLQNFGNRMRELFGDTFWVDQILPNPDTVKQGGVEEQMEAALDWMYPDADCVVITDARYPNEAERVKALGGVVWEVLRPGVTSDGHISEKPLPPYLIDYKIINDGDLDVLEGRVLTALETL